VLCSDGTRRCRIIIIIFFNLAASTQERKRTTNSSTRKKKRKKEPEKRKKENFETCLVSFFSAVGSPPLILALLVGSQQHKLP
jgi:hypothetical protein